MNKLEQNNTASHSLKIASVMSGGLIVIKLLAFVFSGSMLVLASLFDSIVDTIMSWVNFKISKKSHQEADTEHPFGHGGFEVVAALVQGAIIAFLGISLFVESVRKVFGTHELMMESQAYLVGAGVLAFSALAGYVIQVYLDRAIKEVESKNNRSLSLEADKAHYLGDVIANLLSAVGMILVWYTEQIILDQVLGCIAAIFLMKTAYPILRKSYSDIVHEEADPELQKDIVKIVMDSDSRIMGVHNLRTRELGPILFIDFHMTIKGNMFLEEAHELGEAVESVIKNKYSRADIFIHLDPESEEEHQDWEPSYDL